MDNVATIPEITDRIVAWLRSVGVSVEAKSLPDDGFLPAMTVADGVLYYDPQRMLYPGDLLHEAGHIAMTDPALRPTVSDFDAVESADTDEVGAICWSYAAALAAGIDPRVVFHPDGYKGRAESLAMNFEFGMYLGLPTLQNYGLAARNDEDHPRFPAMKQWLR